MGRENLRDKGPPSASTAAHFLQIPWILKGLRADGDWRALWACMTNRYHQLRTLLLTGTHQ